MNPKILKIGAAVPLLALGVLGYNSSAKAANFELGGQVNIATAAQLDSTFTGQLPTGEGGGLDNGETDVIFAPTLPSNFTLPFPFTGDMDDLVSDDNRILDVDDPPGGGFDRDAGLGDFGEIVATAGNSGVFQGRINTGDLGVVKNFDLDPANASSINGLGANDSFIQFDDFRFSLDVDSVSFSPLTFVPLQTTGGNARVDFDALGQVIDTSDGTTANVRYDFTAQFLFDSGEGGDPVALDFATGIGSVSGSIIVEGQDIPEPSSILGMLVLGGGFLSQGLLRKKLTAKS